MKKITNLLTIILLSLLVLSLGGCKKDGKTDYTVGICQLVQHSALDKATEGFKDGLIAELNKNSKTVKIEEENAQGDSTICTTIVNSFVSKKVDLIMANATPALQAATNATLSIPILGTSVTEYGVALGIDNFSGTVGSNISGTSDLAPLDDQAQLIIDLFPEAKKVGLLYCSAEANSLYQVKKIAEILTAKGIETKEFSFSDSNDLSSICTSCANYSDVIFVPTDNTCASNAELIDSICRPLKKPIIAGEEGICKSCGVATIAISYYNIGYKTGQMAAEILLGTKNIKDMAIAYDENPVKKFNLTIGKEYGFNELPDGFVEV